MENACRREGKRKEKRLIKHTVEMKEKASILYCSCIHALKLLTEYKLIDRNYVHAGHAVTHLLPRLH